MTQSISSFPKDEERASFFTSFSGSVSIEAAFAIPFFFLAVCCLCYLLEIICIQSYVRGALHDTGKVISKEIYMVPMVSSHQMENKMVEAIGADRLDRSIIKNGSRGLDLGDSSVNPITGMIQMNVKYEISLPIFVFGQLSMPCEDSIRIKGWNGYVKEGPFLQNEEIVYITESGAVYHKDYHCSYLDLSIQIATKKTIVDLRNRDGEKYYACQFCGKGAGEKVYYTEYGNRYHSSLSCSGLKRKIYAVRKSEVLGKGACSKCGL